MRRTFTCITLFFLVLGTTIAMAQTDSLVLKFDKESYQVGDTISFAALYTEKGIPIHKGSLFLKMVDQTGRSSEMRWPILGGISQGNIVIPDSFPASKLKFFFGASRQFFVIYGFVKQPTKTKTLGITLVTQGNQLLVEELPLSKDGFFEYKDRVFENEATIFFSTTKGNSNELHIEIASLVDSVIPKSAHQEKEIIVGDYKETDTLLAKLTYENLDSFFNARADLLAPVIVSAKKRSLAEQFNDKYSTGEFRGFHPRIFDLLEDPEGQSAVDMGDYLARFVFPKTPYLSRLKQYYLDEMRVDWQTAAMIPVSEVAIVKTFPSPFFANPTGTGAAIAIYTKRGEFYNSPNKHTFRVKGYSPQTILLKLKT